MISGLLCDTEIITNDQQQENTPNVSQENSEHNHSANNTELTKSYSENVKTVTKCHDQNSTLDDPNVDILESENQIFENKVRRLRADGKIKDKTIRSKIYKEMKPFLPNITDVNLRKKTERAQKILKGPEEGLFGEGGVGIDRIKYITYSASTISGLKDTQIQVL
ncbi:hypothetical protein RhiirA4_477973 [Rhizophagus irregularis]|uniref:Uncharacterized protein n=1 Tax=Rhizophagus irregularis TaxID=588596 RepID=A0A2I1HE08_9GLOM|nr:hypothetical protein RhiirA4_477973 [Rhizophagus irregularis]